MKRRVRFGLAFFLIAVLVLGSGIGMSVRYYRCLPHHFVQKTRGIDRYRVSGCWRVDRGGNDELVWLLVFADGDAGISGGGDGYTSAAYVRNFENAGHHPGIGVWNRGLFNHGRMYEGSDQGYIWMYLTTNQTLKKLEIPDRLQSKVSMQAFEQLQSTLLWKEHLRIELDRESAAFQQQFDAKIRTRNPNEGKGNVPPN